MVLIIHKFANLNQHEVLAVVASGGVCEFYLVASKKNPPDLEEITSFASSLFLALKQQL